MGEILIFDCLAPARERREGTRPRRTQRRLTHNEKRYHSGIGNISEKQRYV